ncbi:hypothetical protein PR048_025415 [Dryococelus australis]|uniref:Uncharacterized protein n=1 Tax=Dryococelus australis TaxID=614101 RepID=A0ABQ9GRC3_9NEOP|nr:hypothetical protein PR048_025415 [Dryococelus australis]
MLARRVLGWLRTHVAGGVSKGEIGSYAYALEFPVNAGARETEHEGFKMRFLAICASPLWIKRIEIIDLRWRKVAFRGHFAERRANALTTNEQDTCPCGRFRNQDTGFTIRILVSQSGYWFHNQDTGFTIARCVAMSIAAPSQTAPVAERSSLGVEPASTARRSATHRNASHRAAAEPASGARRYFHGMLRPSYQRGDGNPDVSPGCCWCVEEVLKSCVTRHRMTSHTLQPRYRSLFRARTGTKGRGKTGDLRENPPTSAIVRHDSHLRESGSDPAGDRTRFALEEGERANRSAPTAPFQHDKWLQSSGTEPGSAWGGSRGSTMPALKSVLKTSLYYPDVCSVHALFGAFLSKQRSWQYDFLPEKIQACIVLPTVTDLISTGKRKKYSSSHEALKRAFIVRIYVKCTHVIRDLLSAFKTIRALQTQSFSLKNGPRSMSRGCMQRHENTARQLEPCAGAVDECCSIARVAPALFNLKRGGKKIQVGRNIKADSYPRHLGFMEFSPFSGHAVLNHVSGTMEHRALPSSLSELTLNPHLAILSGDRGADGCRRFREVTHPLQVLDERQLWVYPEPTRSRDRLRDCIWRLALALQCTKYTASPLRTSFATSSRPQPPASLARRRQGRFPSCRSRSRHLGRTPTGYPGVRARKGGRRRKSRRDTKYNENTARQCRASHLAAIVQSSLSSSRCSASNFERISRYNLHDTTLLRKRCTPVRRSDEALGVRKERNADLIARQTARGVVATSPPTPPPHGSWFESGSSDSSHSDEGVVTAEVPRPPEGRSHNPTREMEMEQRRNPRAGVSGRSSREPTDQRHRPVRFPRVKTRERTPLGIETAFALVQGERSSRNIYRLFAYFTEHFPPTRILKRKDAFGKYGPFPAVSNYVASFIAVSGNVSALGNGTTVMFWGTERLSCAR